MAGATSAAMAEEAGQQKAQTLLERMMRAVHLLNYEGTFIYLHNNQLESMQIVHAMHGDKFRERLVSLNGAAREVIRDSESVTCVMPDVGRVSIDPRPNKKRFALIGEIDLEQLVAHYRFQLLGNTRIAGRNADVVAVVPRDLYRYGYRLYLDEESGLPLKSDLMDEKGKPLEQIMFTALKINPMIVPDHSEEKDEQVPEQSEVELKAQKQVTKSRWQFQQLPQGFELATNTHLSSKSNDPATEHMVLTDGLASVSVFVEQAGSAQALMGSSRMGAVNAWGGEVEGHQVTVVGEVPSATVEQVAQAMRLIDRPETGQ